jgi:hypothetical protein
MAPANGIANALRGLDLQLQAESSVLAVWRIEALQLQPV